MLAVHNSYVYMYIVWCYNPIVAKSYLLLLCYFIHYYICISELAMYMQGVLHFFEFLLKHHGPISG